MGDAAEGGRELLAADARFVRREVWPPRPCTSPHLHRPAPAPPRPCTAPHLHGSTSTALHAALHVHRTPRLTPTLTLTLTLLAGERVELNDDHVHGGDLCRDRARRGRWHATRPLCEDGAHVPLTCAADGWLGGDAFRKPQPAGHNLAGGQLGPHLARACGAPWVRGRVSTISSNFFN